MGRMAVHPALRSGGIGAQVLQALMAVARERGDRELMLHAQTGAVDFYRRAGFIERGPHFESAGIVHVEMVRAL